MIRILIEREETTKGTRTDFQKVADTGGRDGGADYQYVPHEVETTKTTKLLEQFVPDDLDIPAVIAVINGLEKK